MLASGDSSGIVTIWSLDEENNTLVQMVRMEDWAGFPVTTLCIWNKYKEVCIVWCSYYVIPPYIAGPSDSRVW